MGRQKPEHTARLQQMPRHRLRIKDFPLIIRPTLHPEIIPKIPLSPPPPRRIIQQSPRPSPAESARVVVVLMVVVRRGAGRRLVGLLGEGLVVRRGVEPRIRAVRRGGLRVGRGGGADRDQQRCGTQDRAGDEVANCVGAVGVGVLVCGHELIVAG